MTDVKPKNEKEAAPKVEVRFRVKSYQIDAGEVREVDAATAEQLVEDGHAVRVEK